MSNNNDIIKPIERQLLIRARYNGNHIVIAPLVFGKINGELKVRAIHVDGFSKSKIQGTSKSDFRLYDFDKLTDVEPMMEGFTINATKNFLTTGFDSVIAVVDSE
jgi:hypothetical protein